LIELLFEIAYLFAQLGIGMLDRRSLEGAG
jgi:hypothetical protein